MANAQKNWKNKIDSSEREILPMLQEGHKVPVAEVRVGDEIITKWTRSGRVAASTKISERVPCPGGNGMHVHLNKSNCYDSRAFVYVK